jgi:hypothetical protein
MPYKTKKNGTNKTRMAAGIQPHVLGLRRTNPSRMEQEENHSGKGTIPILNSGTPVERRHSFKLHRKHPRQWHANDCRNNVGYSITFQVRFLKGWAPAMAPGYSTKWRLVPTSGVTGFLPDLSWVGARRLEFGIELG